MSTVSQQVKGLIETALGPETLDATLKKFGLRHEPPTQTFRIGIEKPVTRETVADSILIKGWALSLDKVPCKARVLFDNGANFHLPINVKRPDVAKIFQLGPDQDKVGFEQHYTWSQIFEKGGQKKEPIGVSLEFTHGKDVLLSGPIEVSKTDTPLLLHERGSYKDVWNDASSNHTYAMDSVSGFHDFEEFMESGRSSAETMIKLLEITKEDTVLEVGCGTGRIGAALAPHCKKWIGSDISSNMLGFAKKNLESLSNVELVELSTCGLSEFEDQSIDKLYISAVFMHLDEWDRFRYVKDAYRVLKPGGKIYIDNINLGGSTGWDIFSDMAKHDPAQRPPTVSKTSTSEELEIYLSQAGFKDIEKIPGKHMVIAYGSKK